MNYEKFLFEDQRLVILRILFAMPAYRANSSVLYNLLGTYGHTPSRDQVKGHITWLSEQALVTVDAVDDILIATLTERGSDVAQGRITHPGVKRPGA